MFLAAGRNLVSYARFTDEETIVVVINSGDEELEVSVPVWRAFVPMVCDMRQILMTGEAGYSIMPVERRIEKGMLSDTLAPHTGLVLLYQ